MRIPPFLNNGDTIGIVSVSNHLNFKIDETVTLLESWGYSVLLGETVSSSYHQFSGTDEDRTLDLQKMLDSELVKCILFACGGYGAVRVLDSLQFNRFMEHPKWLVGYSDVTVFHTFLKEKLGMASIHSSMPVDFKNATQNSLDSLRSILKGDSIQYELDAHPLNRLGDMNGMICGGNLSILYSLMGSPSGLNPSGMILLLEDIGEKLYHVDRMMMNLKRSGKLKGLKGLICGAFSSMKDNEIPFGKSAVEIVIEHTAEYDYPLMMNFPSGHISDNHALIFGIETRVDIKKNGVRLTQNDASLT